MKTNYRYNSPFKLAFLFVVCLAPFCALAIDPVGELMDHGQSAINSGKYTEAIKFYSEVYNLPIASDNQKQIADSKLAYCQTQLRNIEMNQKIQRAKHLFSKKKYDECITFCVKMLATYRSNKTFRNLISQCNDSITAANNRQVEIIAENLRVKRLSDFKSALKKSYRYYNTLHYLRAKNIYDSIRVEYPDLLDSIPEWTTRCDSIVTALKKHEAVDWNLIWALNGIREKGSIRYIGNLSEGYFVISLNNGSLCLLTPDGQWKYMPNTGIANDEWLRFNSGLLGPLYFQDKSGNLTIGGGYYSSNRGFINTNGERVLCDIVNRNDSKGIYSGPYTNGYAVSWHYKGSNKKYGVINAQGETVIPFEYNNIYYIQGGFVCDKSNEVVIIDRSYKIIHKFKGHIVSSHYSNSVVVYYKDKQCQLLVNPDLSITDNVNINYRGDVYLRAAYSNKYTDGFALVTDDTKWFENIYKKMGSKWYFVDRDGVPLKNSSNFNRNSRFHNGLAPIHRKEGWGIIDKFGNTTFIEDYSN